MQPVYDTANAVDAQREESRRTLARVLVFLGHRPELAARVEQREYAAGRLWRERA